MWYATNPEAVACVYGSNHGINLYSINFQNSSEYYIATFILIMLIAKGNMYLHLLMVRNASTKMVFKGILAMFVVLL